MLEPGLHAPELPRPGVESVKYVDHALGIVGEVVHVGCEDAAIRRLGHEPDSMQPLGRNRNVKTLRQIQREVFAIGEMDGVRYERSNLRETLTHMAQRQDCG